MKKNKRNLTKSITIRIDPYLYNLIKMSEIDIKECFKNVISQILTSPIKHTEKEIKSLKKEYNEKRKLVLELDKELSGLAKKIKKAEKEDIILVVEFTKKREEIIKELNSITEEMIVLLAKIKQSQENINKEYEEELKEAVRVAEAIKRRGVDDL